MNPAARRSGILTHRNQAASGNFKPTPVPQQMGPPRGSQQISYAQGKPTTAAPQGTQGGEQ
jgi:hypothetical protein